MTDNGLPKRKPNRLATHDYRRDGAYFITVCTKDRAPILSRISNNDTVGAVIGRPPSPLLTAYGRIVEDFIKQIPLHYPHVTIDHAVIMPNHVHLLIQIHTPQDNGRPMTAPTISDIINQFKSRASRKIGHTIWQKSFHDRVVRDRHEYRRIAAYVENNPRFWHEDCFYGEGTT